MYISYSNPIEDHLLGGGYEEGEVCNGERGGVGRFGLMDGWVDGWMEGRKRERKRCSCNI